VPELLLLDEDSNCGEIQGYVEISGDDMPFRQMNAATPIRRLLRTKEAAQYLSMSPWSLRHMVERRELPYISSGDNTSAWRFDVRDLDRWIETHRIGPK
jgi:excisionase family DNA binding protein